jgi:hypothetical protein
MRTVMGALALIISVKWILILAIFTWIAGKIFPKAFLMWWRSKLLKRAMIQTDKGLKIRGGFVHNPLTRYPRNYKCFCGKDEKAKFCCLPTLNPVCSPKEAFANRYAVKWAELMMEKTLEHKSQSST